MNLTTSIDTLTFNSDGQMLAIPETEADRGNCGNIPSCTVSQTGHHRRLRYTTCGVRPLVQPEDIWQLATRAAVLYYTAYVLTMCK